MIRFLTSVLFILAGTNLCTYAYTRYTTTKRVLSKAGMATEHFLERHGIYPPADAPVLMTLEERDLSAKTLIGGIKMAGGMYYWWNYSLPFYGYGILLISVGVLLPFVRRRTLGGAPNARNDESR